MIFQKEKPLMGFYVSSLKRADIFAVNLVAKY